jgi:hypothetical protein
MNENSVFNTKIAAFLKERNVGLFGFAYLSSIPEDERYEFPRSISLK